MAYITKYTENVNKDNLLYNLKNIPTELKLEGIESFKIGDFIVSNKQEGYICGKIAVKRYFEDYSFNLDEDFEISKELKEAYIYDEVDFTIYSDLKIITFGSKEKAKFFGMKILSNVLFQDENKIAGLVFNPQKVLEAKQSGVFENVWFNGVRFDGKIQYCAQFGTEIDEDTNFTDDPNNRMGIGIVFNSRSGKNLKVAVYQEGTLLCHTRLRDFKEEIIMEKEITKKFLPYSSYTDPILERSVDEFSTLEGWI